jgi:ribosomal protein S18 acetylase RimI-like enzyme
MDTRTCYRVAIDGVTSTDLETLAAWITDAREAPLISDLDKPEVTATDMRRWLEASVEALIVRLEDAPIAFGTLSRKEAQLPDGSVEACHVIVRPDCRRRFKGTQLVAELMDRARKLGFRYMVGRVVPLNVTSHGFVQSLGWMPAQGILKPDDPRFVWYHRALEI